MNWRMIISAVVLMFGMQTGKILAQENIALTATGIRTSHVSSWEDLYAINNNIDPESSTDKNGGAYGNWTGTNEVWQWVEYYWDQLYEISQSDIYWWTDGGGIQIPFDTYQEYYDVLSKEWKTLPDVVGNGIEANKYNITSFSPVLTNKIRVHMVSTQATGILEWKVWGNLGEQIPSGSSAVLDQALAKNTDSELLLTAKTDLFQAVDNYVFKLDIDITNELSGYNETYSINGTGYSTSVSAVELPPSDASGEVAVNISLPADIDYMDGLHITVLFNDGKTVLAEFSYFEPGLIPPDLNPDTDQNNTDQDIVLTFTDDAAWRTAVQEIYVNETLLSAPADYEITAGNIILKPSGDNPALTLSGEKSIKIMATGYEDAMCIQTIHPGAIDVDTSSVTTLLKLYRPTSTSIRIACLDKYHNPVAGVSLKYAATLTNNNTTTSEVYELDGVSVSSDISNQTTVASNAEGIILLPLSIPRSIDLNDGITIDFSLEDETLLTQNISYLNDGTDKALVIQNAVKNHADFSWDRTAQSDNFIIYWGAKINGDPSSPANGNISFEPNNILEIMESLLTYFNDSIGFIENPDERNMGTYKHEIVMNETWTSLFTGYAFGGWADRKIGAMWIHPSATGGPAVLAHEFTHMNQCMVMLQYPGYGLNTPAAGFFWESHANFMMKTYTGTYSGVQPERYVFTSMMHFSTTRRHYQNVYFIDYLVDKYGLQTVNDIWRKANPNVSHPLTSLRDSVLRYTQDDLNDEFIYHAMKNVTWDYSTGKKIRSALASVDPIYVQRMYTVPDTVFDEPGTYIVPEYLAPGDYGYNIIPLYPDEAGNEITIDFRGLDNASSGGAGWRYGFVAVDNSGNPRYSSIYRDAEGTATFSVDAADSAIYFVVTGAPAVHHNYLWEVGYPKNYRYPYTFQVSGAKPEGYATAYNSQQEAYPGAPHPNGGGWVAAAAQVASTAWVGPNAQVLGTAKVYDNARVEDYAIVTDNAVIRNSAIIRDHAIVGRGSTVRENAIVEKSARVYNNSSLSGNAVATGSALLYGVTLSGQAVVKDLARLSNASISGTAIIGGDAEDYNNVSSGTYLQFTRRDSPDGQIDHSSNLEVNPYWQEYVYPKGEKPLAPENLRSIGATQESITLAWDSAIDHREVNSYYLYRNGTIAAIVNDTSYTVSGLSAGSMYSFTIKAVDRSGNVSALSETLFASTIPVTVPHTEVSGLKIYPNPAEDIVYIESPFMGSSDLTIRDVAGRLIFSETFSGTIRIESGQLGESGMYLAEVRKGKQACMAKFLLSK